MFQWFLRGGPVMWPILVTSIVSLAVVIERFQFVIREARKRRPDVVEKIFACAETGRFEQAVKEGQGCEDFLAKILVYGLRHREKSFSNALVRAANRELKRFNQGLSALDTIITLAPLLGLLGTVTGMIHAFGLLGQRALGAPVAITGGIAQALIATAWGLGIAIMALIPFNYFNALVEQTRHEIEDASTRLELLLIKSEKTYENYLSGV